MKRLLTALIVVISLTLTFTSCKKNTGIVLINLQPSDTALFVTPGQSLIWSVSLIPELANNGAVGKFEVTANGQVIFARDYKGAVQTINESVIYTVPTDAQHGDKINVVFTATDANSGLTNSKNVTLTVLRFEGTVTIELTPSDTLIYAQPNDTVNWNVKLIPDLENNGAIGTFTVSADQNTIYQNDFQAAKQTIDLNISYVVPEDAQLHQQITITFTATDAYSGLTTTKQVKIYVYQYLGVVQMSINPSGDQQVLPSQTINWTITLTPDLDNFGAIGNFTVFVNDNPIFQVDYGGSQQTIQANVSHTIPSIAQAGDQYLVKFIVEDANSHNITKDSLLLTVKATYLSDPLINMTYDTNSLQVPMMLNCTINGVLVEDGTSNTAQIAYVYGSDIGHTIASPDANIIAQIFSTQGISYLATDKETTYIRKLSSTEIPQWNDITPKDIDIISITASNTDNIAGNYSYGYGSSNLNVGDILIFYNATYKIKGVIYINSLSANIDGANAQVSVKYLIYQ